MPGPSEGSGASFTVAFSLGFEQLSASALRPQQETLLSLGSSTEVEETLYEKNES